MPICHLYYSLKKCLLRCSAHFSLGLFFVVVVVKDDSDCQMAEDYHLAFLAMQCLGVIIYLVVQSLSCVQLFATPWTAAHQGPLCLTIFWSLPKFMSIESVMLLVCEAEDKK